MRRSVACAALTSAAILLGCQNDGIESPNNPEIESHKIDGIETLKITYKTRIDSQSRQYRRTTVEEHFIDFENQMFRRKVNDIFEEFETRESTYTDLILGDTRFRVDQDNPSLYITEPYFGLGRPWFNQSWKFSTPIEKEMIAGVECDVYEDQYDDKYFKTWKWNGIALKDIRKSHDESEELEAIELVINPKLEEEYFDIPTGAEVITEEEHFRRDVSMIKELMDEENEERRRRKSESH